MFRAQRSLFVVWGSGFVEFAVRGLWLWGSGLGVQSSGYGA